MAIDFPTSPTTGQAYTYLNKTYVYDGEKWTASPGTSGLIAVASGGTGQSTEAEALGEMIQALTEDTAPVSSTDFVTTYDASADTGKKVLLANLGVSGINFGGTAAANLLDDYEEGTWSPTLTTTSVNFSSVTYDALTGGRYTKIGNKVYIQGTLQTDAVTVGSASGAVAIGNLPFTSAAHTGSTNDGTACITLGFVASWLGEIPIAATMNANTVTFTLHYRAGITTLTINTAVSDVATGANGNLVCFGGSYIAA